MQDIPIDEKTFIVEVTDKFMEPEIPQGSLCVFRSGATNWRDGNLILVQKQSSPNQSSYSIKRYQGEETCEKKGILSCSTRGESLNSGDGQSECPGCVKYILGQFVCILE